MHSVEKRTQLRIAYVFEHLSMKQAAEKHGVQLRTAWRWKSEALEKGDDWDAARAAHSMSGLGAQAVVQAVLNDYLLQHQAALGALRKAAETGQVDPVKTADTMARLTDSFMKMISCANRLMPEVSKLGVALDVIQALQRFIADRYPQHRAVFLEVLPAFGDEVQNLWKD